MDDVIDLIGFFSGFCTTIAFLPQVIKAYRTKSTKDVSLLMFLVFTIGVGGWLIYGVLLMNIPIIIANILTLFLAFLILIAKIRFG